MASSGLGSQFGAKKESAWGTAVTVDTFFEYSSESLSRENEYYEPETLRAGRTFQPSGTTRQTGRNVAGDTSLPFPTKKGGFFLDQMVAGTITPVQVASTIAYNSTFNIGASVPTKSATLQINKPTTQGVDTPFTYPGARLQSAAFSMEVGGGLQSTFNWVAKDETNPTTTPAGAALASATYVSGTSTWAHSDVTLTLNATPAAAITSLNWTWEQPRAIRRFLGSGGTIADPVPNGLATVAGTFSGEWYDETYYDLFCSGAFAALVVTFTHPVAIVGTEYPTFTNTFSAIQLRGSSPQVSGPEMLAVDIPWVARDDGTNPPWQAIYKSSDSAAW